jgi:cytochrome c peroxidase
MIRWAWPVSLFCVCLGAVAAPPLGLPPLAPVRPALVELGRQLFFDRGLSVNGTLSCAMCHVPAQGFTVNELRTAVGMAGVSLRRNAPTLLNVAHVSSLFLDGRAATLEAQALEPLVHPDEMANADLAAVMRRIRARPAYRQPFVQAFGSPRPTPARVAAALAAFERSLVAADTPFDRWRYGGEANALSPIARRGFEVFLERGCGTCHAVGQQHALFTDGQFHNTGVQARSDARRDAPARVTLVPGLEAGFDTDTLRRIGVVEAPDLGRFEVTGRTADTRAFRTPTLRNVALTAPYMHDGSLATLDAVLDHYARGGTSSDPVQDPRIRPFALDAEDRAALLAFLDALTSPAAQALDGSPAGSVARSPQLRRRRMRRAANRRNARVLPGLDAARPLRPNRPVEIEGEDRGDGRPPPRVGAEPRRQRLSEAAPAASRACIGRTSRSRSPGSRCRTLSRRRDGMAALSCRSHSPAVRAIAFATPVLWHETNGQPPCFKLSRSSMRQRTKESRALRQGSAPRKLATSGCPNCVQEGCVRISACGVLGLPSVDGGTVRVAPQPVAIHRRFP